MMVGGSLVARNKNPFFKVNLTLVKKLLKRADVTS